MFFGFDLISGVALGIEVVSGEDISDEDGMSAKWGLVLELFVIRITMIKL